MKIKSIKWNGRVVSAYSGRDLKWLNSFECDIMTVSKDKFGRIDDNHVTEIKEINHNTFDVYYSNYDINSERREFKLRVFNPIEVLYEK